MYRVYIKGKYGYSNPTYYKTKQELFNYISSLKEEYLIIKRENNTDEVVEYKPCNVVYTDNIKNNVKVKAKSFYIDEKNIDKEIRNYIDR